MSTPEWTAERVVDAAEAARRLAVASPELAGASVRLLDIGWDMTVHLVDERLVARFPRRAIALPGLDRELRALPRLAPLLPLPVPVPVVVGGGGDGTWPFWAAPLLRGVEAARLPGPFGGALARALGEFLRALHDPATAALVDPDHALPVDPNGRTDGPRRAAMAAERLGELAALGVALPTRALQRVVDEGARLGASPAAAALVHGDLHARHLLVDAGQASGVIDWGDVCRAEPAIDLLLVFALLEPDERAVFVDAYGELDRAMEARARLLAVQVHATLAVWALHERVADVAAGALAGIARATR